MTRSVVRKLLWGWRIWCFASGILCLASLFGIGIVWLVSGDDAVVVATDVRDVITETKVGGRYGYVYDLDRKESCLGEVVTSFTTKESPTPAILTTRRPTLFNEVKSYPGLKVDNPLPANLSVGKWEVDVVIVSKCVNRDWSDPISHFTLDVTN